MDFIVAEDADRQAVHVGILPAVRPFNNSMDVKKVVVILATEEAFLVKSLASLFVNDFLTTHSLNIMTLFFEH